MGADLNEADSRKTAAIVRLRGDEAKEAGG
jgi:hypothetical protein